MEWGTSCCSSGIALLLGWSWSVNLTAGSAGVCVASTGWQQQRLPEAEEAIAWGGGEDGARMTVVRCCPF